MQPQSPSPFPYRITLAWSEDDEAYIARVPAIETCAADGPTPEAAVSAVLEVAQLHLEVLADQKRPFPPTDI